MRRPSPTGDTVSPAAHIALDKLAEFLLAPLIIIGLKTSNRLSHQAFELDPVRGFERPFVENLRKPIDPYELAQKVSEVLRSPQ